MNLRPLVLSAVLAACVLPVAATAAPTETFVETQGPTGVLKGTMLSPGKTAPVALIIPGSGPTDRDGNGPLGLRGSSYRLLAEALADRGVASVRVDKRGQFGSAGAAVDPATFGIDDYAADVKAWVAELRRRTGRDCVWLAGHSEGALVSAIAAQDARGICGLVLIAGGGRRLSDVIRQQILSNPANPPEVVEQSKKALSELEAGRMLDTSSFHPALQPLFGAQVQPYLISVFRHDPAALLKTYEGPVLVVQGTTDIQITMEDAERLAAARDGIRLAKIDGMNHVLKTAPAERMANIATYADPSLPLAPGLADAVAEFVKAN